MDVAERDKRYVAREEPADGVQVARSDGCFVFDHHGKKYNDFTAGSCVGIWARETTKCTPRSAPSAARPTSTRS